MSVLLKKISDYVTGYVKEKRPNVQATDRIRDLGIDSLDLVELLMALEETFDVEINADEIDQDMTLDQLCDLVARHK